jgi:hypothetical protein
MVGENEVFRARSIEAQRSRKSRRPDGPIEAHPSILSNVGKKKEKYL